MFCIKPILKNFTKLKEKHVQWISFLVKPQAVRISSKQFLAAASNLWIKLFSFNNF